MRQRHIKSAPQSGEQQGGITDENSKGGLLNRCSRALQSPAGVSVLLLACLALFAELVRENRVYIQGKMSATMNAASEKDSTGGPKSTIASIDWKKYKSCSISFKPPPLKPKDTWDTKPMWAPQFPDSFNEKTLKALVQGVTGITAAAKSFYAIGGGVKYCKGRTESVFCLLVHPTVQLNPDPDDIKWTSIRHENLIYILRNPRTAIPAHHNVKAIKYHGAKGQVPEEEWRAFRDQYVEEMVATWKESLRAWANLKNYKLKMYVVYEHLMDPIRGPEELKRLATLIEESGFPTFLTLSPTPHLDLPCIWYKAIGRSALELHQKSGYDFFDRQYIPGYTPKQRDFLVQELTTFQEEYHDDRGLVAILEEYVLDVEEKAPLDKV